MIIKQYIKDFEELGFGMFVHFGLYSRLGRGEWSRKLCSIDPAEYEATAKAFDPDPDWAPKLVKSAKDAGCRYITITTRHHDGFSLYDTKGLSTFDAPHFCGRDLIREFVDACRAEGIVPFFYHTLLDWHEARYNTDFPAYLAYLRASVEILCSNYGKIGGLWFDGMWDKPDADWEEDALYSAIRRHQPEAMIINNTGLSARGALGHIELDSVTFERGRPQPINLEGSPKYIASEMCQVFADHWGYAARDLNFKSLGSIIEDLCICRRYGSNFLLNVGPMGDGLLCPLDAAMLGAIGEWTRIYGEAVYTPAPAKIETTGNEKDFLLRAGNTLYLFVHDLGMVSDPNVALEAGERMQTAFALSSPIKSAIWMDSDIPVRYEQTDGRVTVYPLPFSYGENLVVRVAKIELEK